MNKRRVLPVLLILLILCGAALAALDTVYRAGIDRIKQPLPILMYHQIVADGEETNSMIMEVGRLRQDFQWLADNGYHPVLPSELLSEELPPKPVLITFDDGYRSSYELLYPLLQEFGFKAVVSIMVRMQDVGADEFLTWDMCREMEESGLVEIGSHAYRLHNLDGRGGLLTKDGVNGVQRDPTESDEAFEARVLGDIQTSYDLIEVNLGHPPLFFAYPFGIRVPDAEAFIDGLFPITVITKPADTVFRTADLANGLHNLPRFNITMTKSLQDQLAPPLVDRLKAGVKALLGRVS